MRREKGEDESFSDVIDRFLNEEEHPLYGLVGLAQEAELERIREGSQSFRMDVERRMDADTQADQ